MSLCLVLLYFSVSSSSKTIFKTLMLSLTRYKLTIFWRRKQNCYHFSIQNKVVHHPSHGRSYVQTWCGWCIFILFFVHRCHLIAAGFWFGFRFVVVNLLLLDFDLVFCSWLLSFDLLFSSSLSSLCYWILIWFSVHRYRLTAARFWFGFLFLAAVFWIFFVRVWCLTATLDSVFCFIVV